MTRSASRRRPARSGVAAVVAACVALTGCNDTEAISRAEISTPVSLAEIEGSDGTPTGSAQVTVPPAGEPETVTSPSPVTTQGSAADWDLSGGPTAVASRIDVLSGQDVGVALAGNTLTLYVAGDTPDWLTGLQEAAAGSDLTIQVESARYGRIHLLSAAQELLPQVLPLGVTEVAPATDQSKLLLRGDVPAKDRAGIEALAAAGEYPVEIAFTDR